MKFKENDLEKAIIDLFKQEDYQYVNGKEIERDRSEVILKNDLIEFLQIKYLTAYLTESELERIVMEVTRTMSQDVYEENKRCMKLVMNGFTFIREDQSLPNMHIDFIDFETCTNNVFKIVNQFEIEGNHLRIPDGIVFINGLPLVVLEFKTAIEEKTTIHDAYTQLTVRYRRDIPKLFKYNALCVISDGINSKVGSFFASYNFFYSWRKITGDEAVEKDGIDSLFTMMKGLFQHERLLKVIQHFMYFPDKTNKEEKIVPRYPQFYAATKLFESIKLALKPEGDGKGGTYFGATGCGKSYTMLFLTRLLMKSKELRSPTIVLITDRTDLDDQLAKLFTNSKEYIGDQNIISVDTRDELKELIGGCQSGGVFLTTIQKFTESTNLLTDRTNVICISDEAHRSQVNLEQKVRVTKDGLQKTFGFAKYLHDSLPNATYVGFTGTPIDATMNVFGEIKDAYTMREAVYDEITSRIVYEGRAAKVNLNDLKLAEIEDYYKQCIDEGSNEYQVDESKRAMTQMEVILGDTKRIKLIAQDFVEHYENRVAEGSTVKGKVMFVAANRQIAYDLYKEIITLRPEWTEIKEYDDSVSLTEQERKEIKPIEKIKMVMTRNKDDDKELYNLLGNKDYRKELDRQFKNEKSNFKIVIVVDMWLTGFDVPSLDTIYIDKPIQQHTLIQTISRVNRIYEEKEAGLVVDYIGIKNNMNKALKQYGIVEGDNFEGVDKAVTIVKDQLSVINAMFHLFDNEAYFKGTSLQQLQCLNEAVEYVQQTEEFEKRFMGNTKKLQSAYKLCSGSEEISQQERDLAHFYFAIRAMIYKLTKGDALDTSQMNEKVREMVQEALISDGVEEVFKLDNDDSNMGIDIFDDEYLAKIDKIKLPNTKIKLLQKLLKKAIEEFKKVNKVQAVDFSKRLKQLVETYNERKDFQSLQSDVLEDIADRFVDLFEELLKEKNSFADMGIDFEEKAFYDILKSVAEKHRFEYGHDKLIELSKEVKNIVDDKAKYTDWSSRLDIKAQLKVDLILTLAKFGYPPVPQDEIFKEIFEQAENFKKYTILQKESMPH